MKKNFRVLGLFAAGLAALVAGWWWFGGPASPAHKTAGAATVLSQSSPPGPTSTDKSAGADEASAGRLAAAPVQPAANAIVPPPASAVVKTVVDTTPRATNLMKVFRVSNDPPGLAAEAYSVFEGTLDADGSPNITLAAGRGAFAFGQGLVDLKMEPHAGANTVVVLPPVLEYDVDPVALGQRAVAASAIPSEISYLVASVATGQIAGDASFSKSRKQLGDYTFDGVGFGERNTIIAEATNYLASLPIVQAGSYELGIVSYGHYPAPGIAFAVWLRSPNGDQDLMYPLPGGGVIKGQSLPYGMEAKLYPLADFILQLQARRPATGNRAAGS